MISHFALNLLAVVWLFQGCPAANDLFEKAKTRFDTERTTIVSREAAQGYLQQFRRVVELCPGNAAGWYYAHLAAVILNDARANFFRSQAELHGFVPPSSEPVRARPSFEVSVRLVEGTADGVLKEGEFFKLTASIKNTANVSLSGIRIKLNGLPAISDALGAEHYVGDIAVGENRVVELSGKIESVVQETGTIKLEVADVSGARSESPALSVAVRPSVDIDVLPPETASDPRAFAVVVGISRYRNAQVPPIEYATNDAELMAEYLRVFAGVPRTNIRKLVDETATKTDLEVTFKEWLPQRVVPGSRVYVYFAGHGTPLVGADGSPYQNLVPFDARPESPLSFFRLTDMYAALEGLNAASTYVFLDTCFSGAGRSFLPPNTRSLVIQGPAQTEKVIVFTASQSSEPSNDFPRVRHGLFSYFVFRGLQGESDANKDRSITIEELFSFLSDSVPKTAIRVLNRPQTPTLMPELPRLGSRAGGVLASAARK
jgi:hypothetical protein